MGVAGSELTGKELRQRKKDGGAAHANLTSQYGVTRPADGRKTGALGYSTQLRTAARERGWDNLDLRVHDRILAVLDDPKHKAWATTAMNYLDRVHGPVVKEMALRVEVPDRVIVKGSRSSEPPALPALSPDVLEG